MDSEDSRDASSESDSNDKGPKSPDSIKSGGNIKSAGSRSRSSSPRSRARSGSSDQSVDSAHSTETTNRLASAAYNRLQARRRVTRRSSSSTSSSSDRSTSRPHTPVLPKKSVKQYTPPTSPQISQRTLKKGSYLGTSKVSDKSPGSDRSTHSDKSVHSEKSARSSKSFRSDKSARSEKSVHSKKSVGSNKSSESEKSVPSVKSAKSEKSVESHKSIRSEKSIRSDKPVHLKKFEAVTEEKSNPSEKLASSENIFNFEKSNSPGKTAHIDKSSDPSEKFARSGTTVQPEKPAPLVYSAYSMSPVHNKIQAGTPRSPSPQSSLSSPPNTPPRAFSKKRRSENEEKASVKSDSSSSSSSSSRKSRSSRGSRKSLSSSRASRKSRRKSSDGISSDSSDSSVDSSSRKNKNITKPVDTQPEEISDGDIESDHDKDIRRSKEDNAPRPEINISHEDLSDVSDLEESLGENFENDLLNSKPVEKEEEVIVIEDKSVPGETRKASDKNTSRPEEGEEQLDFEAEDGECPEDLTKDEPEEKSAEKEEKKIEEKDEEKEELEEGEVTDEDDVRPEETEPRPVCRFFSRGQCTWGASCRFLHPGVTDKGNYTMFEMIRPVLPGEFRDERLFGKVEPPVVESAWERGLRTAKEMLRKSVKRKEQDIDFEEKKMNLSLAQEEFDKENGYYGRVPSPEPRYIRHVTAEFPVARPPPEEYYGRRQVVYEPEYVAPPVPRERIRSYRELPSHRMPDYYNNKYEEEQQLAASTKRVSKPKREVIVQRTEERQGRGDEWSDPWMRSKSPAGRRKESGRKKSYSSGSSYSSSSSSRSSSTSRSSYRSRTRSPRHPRGSRSRRTKPVSPSVIVSERKAANERAALMNPPAPKRRAPSPGMMRVSAAANPPAPLREDQFGRTRSKLAVAAALARVKGHKSSKSSSGSSGSSSSDSDSSDSSSSSSRDGSPAIRRPAGVDISLVKAMDALKGGALEKKQIKLNLKNPTVSKKPDATVDFGRKPESVPSNKKRAANSPPPGDPKSKKATSRREELLKQLKAVEDAIAKKRSKVN